jgi:hypothetical protein
MSNQALSFIGKLDRREESMIVNENQEHALIKRLLEGRDGKQYRDLFRMRQVRNVYTPATRGVSGKNVVMPKN